MSDPFAEEIVALLPSLRRLALSLCRRGDLADDLVQTAVERAFRARARFDPATRMQAWLFRILRNAWLDDARRTRTRGTEIDHADTPDTPAIDGPRETEARLMLRATERALATLPDEQREVIALVCLQELSYREAADILALPIGTVMSRLARGRLSLAQKLGLME